MRIKGATGEGKGGRGWGGGGSDVGWTAETGGGRCTKTLVLASHSSLLPWPPRTTRGEWRWLRSLSQQ